MYVGHGSEINASDGLDGWNITKTANKLQLFKRDDCEKLLNSCNKNLVYS